MGRYGEVHQEGVRPATLPTDGEVRQHDRLVRGEPLRDPVLMRALGRRVEHKLARRVVVRRLRLHEQARLHARELLCEREAAQQPVGLVLLQSRHLLLRAHRQHGAVALRAGERGEADAVSGARR